MTLKESAEATLEIEYPSQSTIETALDEAERRLYTKAMEYQKLQDKIRQLEHDLYQVEHDLYQAERAFNLFTNALNEQD